MMGGIGSGNRYRFNTANVVEDYLNVDVRYLVRKGLLKPNFYSTLTWSRNGEEIGSIGIYAISESLIELRYTHRKTEHINDPIHIDYTNCNYGGNRAWFICPSCGRRCAILYGGKYYRCRKCYDLRYSTQNMDSLSRALDKITKIKNRIFDSSLGIPLKPKGMHWKTYNRLIEEYNMANAYGWFSLSERIGKIK